MRARMTIGIATLVLGGALAASAAFAQNAARSANDGGMVGQSSQSEIPKYGANGARPYTQNGIVQSGTESSSSCAARFHSFDPASGTYMGRDGRRHPCS